MWLDRKLVSGCLLAAFLCAPAFAEKPPASSNLTPQTLKTGNLVDSDFKKFPTFIKSETLTLKSEQRVFEYSGNVEVKHGDMLLTSDTLEGKYSAQNEIQELVALNNVVITKGENIRGSGNRATYDAATQTVVLTESPELQQSGSVLTADAIKIYLNEDRSEALGQVRVKLIQKDTPAERGPVKRR